MAVSGFDTSGPHLDTFRPHYGHISATFGHFPTVKSTSHSDLVGFAGLPADGRMDVAASHSVISPRSAQKGRKYGTGIWEVGDSGRKCVRIRGQLTIKLTECALFSNSHQTGQLTGLMGAWQNRQDPSETRHRVDFDPTARTLTSPRGR